MNRKNRYSQVASILTLYVLLTVSAIHCRDPLFEDSLRYEGYDPSEPGAGPAPLCPPESRQTINNSISPYLGGEVAPELVVEVFSFFRCPSCANLAAAIDEIWQRRADFRQRVRVYFHHYPLYEHETAMRLHAATIAAQAQGMGNFWQMHDYIFAGLNSDNITLYTPEDLYVFARDVLHLDMVQYEQTVNSNETIQSIFWDKEQGEDLGMVGTPGVFMCGKKVMVWQQNLEKDIDFLLD